LRDYRRAFPEGRSFYFKIRKQTNSQRVPRFVCDVETSRERVELARNSAVTFDEAIKLHDN